MITHEEALESADKVANYCKQNFNGNTRQCVNCQFSLETNENRKCCLDLYVGTWGDAIQEEVKRMVKKRQKELLNGN